MFNRIFASVLAFLGTSTIIGVVLLVTAGAIFGLVAGRSPADPAPPPTTTVTTTAPTTTTTRTTAPTTTTTVPATTTTTTTTAAPRDPITITISRDALMATFASNAVVQDTNAENAIQVAQPRTFTGVAIRDILAQNGVNLAEIPATATLSVQPDSGNAITVSYANFTAATTLIAWYEVNRNTGDTLMGGVPRLVYGDASGMLWGAFTQRVVSITLNFND